MPTGMGEGSVATRFKIGDRRMSFAERYERLAFPEPNSGCFIWMGALNKDGYGVIGIGYESEKNKKNTLAHRVAYEHFVGPIPEGLQLDHLCRVRCCVNPAHLEPVTNAENLRRGMGPALTRARPPITHCKHGHLLSGENLNLYRGVRVCRACRARYARKCKERRRGK